MVDDANASGAAGEGGRQQMLQALAQIVLGEETRDEVLGRVAAAAKSGIAPADDVSLTLVDPDRAYTVAWTGQLALDADEMQYARGHGPCMDAGRAGVTLVVNDMRTEERWPSYAAEAASRGVGSSLSVPLPVQESVIGALNVYSRHAGAFDDAEVVALGEEVAAFAAVAVHNARSYDDAGRLARQMREAMASRAVIEQAKGVVMAHQGCTADEAFAILNRMSQTSNRRLRDLARDITEHASRRRPAERPE